MFCEEGLALELFRNGSVHEVYCLKTLITLKYVNSSVVGEKKMENYNYEKTNWSGVANCHCMQMNLVLSMRFIFGDD